MFITKNLDFFILLCIGVFGSFTSATPRNPLYDPRGYRPGYPQNTLLQGYPGSRSESAGGPNKLNSSGMPYNGENPIGPQKPGYPKQPGSGIHITPSAYPGSQLMKKPEPPISGPKPGSQFMRQAEYPSESPSGSPSGSPPGSPPGSPSLPSYPVLPVMPKMPELPNMPGIYGKQMPRSLIKMFPQLVPFMGYETFNLTVQRFPLFFMNPNVIKK